MTEDLKELLEECENLESPLRWWKEPLKRTAQRVADVEALCRAFARIFVTAQWVSAGMVQDSEFLQRSTEKEIDAAMHTYRTLFDDQEG